MRARTQSHRWPYNSMPGEPMPSTPHFKRQCHTLSGTADMQKVLSTIQENHEARGAHPHNLNCLHYLNGWCAHMRKVPADVRMLSTTEDCCGPTTVERFICGRHRLVWV